MKPVKKQGKYLREIKTGKYFKAGTETDALRVREYIITETDTRTTHVQLLEDGTIGVMSANRNSGEWELMRLTLESFDACLASMTEMRGKIDAPWSRPKIADYRVQPIITQEN